MAERRELEGWLSLALPGLRTMLFANRFPRHKSLANGPLALNPAQLSPSLWCTPFTTHCYSSAWTSLPIIRLVNVTDVQIGSLASFLIPLKCASLNARSLKPKSYFSQSPLYPGFHAWPNFHQADQCTWDLGRRPWFLLFWEASSNVEVLKLPFCCGCSRLPGIYLPECQKSGWRHMFCCLTTTSCNTSKVQ